MTQVAWALASFAAYLSAGTAELRGWVSDLNGAALPGVAVSLQTESGSAWKTVTSTAGTYRFVDLPSGLFALIFEISGFESRRVPVKLVAGAQAKLDMVLVLAEPARDFIVCICDPVIDISQTTRGGTPRAARMVEKQLHVIDMAGQAVPDASVEVAGGEYETDAAGLVCYLVPDRSDVTIIIRAPAFRTVQSSTCCFGDRADVKLRPIE